MKNVGIIGVGLMGHGIAWNVRKHGYPLVVQDHPGNQPLTELLAAGAATRKTSREVAEASDVVILCVTGTPEVEAILTGEAGVLAGLRPGTIVIDCSTAVPNSTARMAELVLEAGGRFVDAPMTRTSRHAREGKLNLLVGCRSPLFEEIKPLLSCFAENIVSCGEIGSGHRMKLLHNYISLGFVAMLAEAAACATRSNIEISTFVKVLKDGGGGGAALERMTPYMTDNDASGLQFAMANARKDVTYYAEMAASTPAEHCIADSVRRTFVEAVNQGGSQCMLPELFTLLLERPLQ